VHAEEADVDAVDLLEGEEGSGAVRKRLAHFAGVNESEKEKSIIKLEMFDNKSSLMWSLICYHLVKFVILTKFKIS
jgi:hypothetical protein